jgi:CRISPR-associated endonuclease/helicase Cas3
MALHLATRLLATRMDKPNPHAASALRKLAKALQRLDKNISQHMLLSADVMDEAAEYHDPVYLDALETLTEAWSAGRKVQVSHIMRNGKVFEYKFSPYFIEPYAVGQTTHVIGFREPPKAIRTFKIERIRRVSILSERYEIPKTFDPKAMLADAWGIWYTEERPVEVTLRFHPRVAMRVRETRWHHSQTLEMQPDGGIVWRARVAEPQEMLPWIRGWGADVEVLGPEGLRETLMGEARSLAQQYGWQVGRQSVSHSILDDFFGE